MMKKLIIIVCLSALALYAFFHVKFPKKKGELGGISSIPELTLWDIDYVKNVHGRPVWNLHVKSAIKDQKTGELKGEDIRLKIFRKARPYVMLYAQHGSANVKKGIFRVWGDVEIKKLKGNCSVEGKEVIFREKEKRLYSKGEVSLVCGDIRLRGKGLVFDMGERALRVEGPVSAILE
ncbi:MAG: LPS export ABC transporter periplasmic protein LptC [Thermodesulfobacteria bacterium]|nr:LPS export ABC transporter periplasmic protein LptC [Thermodesulfobacteriota bacterium]